MPPFITHNGQTGYFQNGVFVPATQEQYNNQMSMYNQFGNNPFVSAQQTFTQQQQSVQQGVIKPPTAAPLSNEQKVSIAQGDATSTNQYNPQDKLNYEFTDKGLGFKAGNQFYPSSAMTTGGMPLIGSPYKGRTLNAYDLAKEDSSKYGNPYLAIQNQLMNNTPPWMSNTTTPNQAQVTVPQTTGATEIIPTSTAEQAGGGNWLTNMFNKPSVEGVPTAENVVDNGLKSDVLGDWGKMGFDTKKAFTGTAGTSALGAGIGTVTKFIGDNASKYDPRVGMSKPNALGTMFSDATFTQIGSMFGPAGMAIGGTVDLLKNAIKYVKQKDKYENKKLATDTMQSIDDARENMKPDYTGYARSGTQVNPYLKAQYGTAIVDGKKMDIDSDEYRRLYNSGNLMRVDEEGMPTMTTEEVVVMDQMTDNTRKQREIQKERDAQGLNYNWSSGSNNPYISQPQSTVPTGINITQPSLPPIEDVLYNTEDDLLNDYRGKSFGSNPFPYNSSDGLAMGYNPNNAWMSTGVGSVDDGTSILGHLAVRYGDDYNDNLKNNDIPTLYFFEKDLSKEKGYLNDVGGDAGKYYDSRKELLEMADIHERESRYINNVLLPQGYTYNTVLDEPGNKLIRSLTPDKDKFMGSVTLTPEMYQQIASSKSPEEAKRKLVKMAKISPDVNMDHLFIHMNLSRPKKLSPYLRAKSINPESVIGWHDERPGNKYDKNGNLIKPTVKTYKQGGKINPYLKKFNPGGKVIVDGKEMSTGSDEYKNLYNAGVLMGVDYEGLPNMYAPEVEVTAQMTDKERVKRGLMTESHRRDKAAMSELSNSFAEFTGIPSLIRVGKDPVGHLQSALRTMDGISTLGTMPYDAYNTPEDLSKALDVAGAAGTVMPFVKPVASGFNQAAKTTGKFLTTQTPLKNAYKFNPYASKEAQEIMLVRARPVGQDPYLNMAERLRAKKAAGENLQWWQENLLKPQYDPSMIAREKYYGQWFADNPSELDYYINPSTRNFPDDAEIEILKARMPKSESAQYSVKNFNDAKILSNLHDNEYILPKDMVQSLKRYPLKDLGKLQAEYKQMNTPHWLKGYGLKSVNDKTFKIIKDQGQGILPESSMVTAAKTVDDVTAKIPNAKEIEEITTYKNDLLNRLKTTEEGKRRLANLGLDPKDLNDIDLVFNQGPSEAKKGFLDVSGNPFININLKQIADNTKAGLTPMNTASHEIAHALQYLAAKKRFEKLGVPLDERVYSGLNIRTPADDEMIDWLKSVNQSEIDFKNSMGINDLPGINKSLTNEIIPSEINASYITERAEPYAHMREFRTNMMDEGILKNEWDNVTEDMVDKFMKTSSGDRMKASLKNTLDFRKRMSVLLNKYPAVIPGVIGTGATAAGVSQLNQKRQGGQTNPYLK
jgi:hypothetical protein